MSETFTKEERAAMRERARVDERFFEPLLEEELAGWE